MAHTTSPSRSSAVAALLLLVAALIAIAAVADDDDDHQQHDDAAGGGKSICDDADCGRGTCVERLGWIPWRSSYKCKCDHGWNRAITMVASSPCNVPECSFNSSCVNLSLLLPRGIPFSDREPSPSMTLIVSPSELFQQYNVKSVPDRYVAYVQPAWP